MFLSSPAFAAQIPCEKFWRESLNYNATNQFPDKNWWSKFNDPVLASYIEEAIRENNDVKTALAKIEESRAYARYVMANELPQLSTYPLYFLLRNQNVKNTGLPFSTGSNRSTSNIFIVPLVARYELDLFQKNRYKTLSAEKEAQAVCFDYETAIISLSAEIATAYFNLVESDKLLGLNKELLCSLQQALQLKNLLYREGEISYDDVLTSQQAISATQSNIEALKKNQGILVHQICILMGKPPVEQSCLPRCDFDSINFNNEITIGSPDTLVSRRPDILAAESRLSEAGINVSVAKREFLPSINIFGTFGFESIPIISFFNLKGMLAGVGVVPSISLFAGGAKIANLKVNKAKCKEALQQYQKTILAAFKDVEDSIKSFTSDFGSYEEASKQVSEAKCLLCLTNTRYREGENSLLDVINSRQQFINNKQNEVQAKTNLLIDNISIYKALGGGF